MPLGEPPRGRAAARRPRTASRGLLLGQPLPVLAAVLVGALLTTGASATPFPAGTGLRIELANGLQRSAVEGGSLSVIVGERVRNFAVQLPSGYGFDSRPSRIKAVDASTTSAEAQAGGCLASGVDSQDIDPPLSASLGAPTVLLNGDTSLSTALGNPVLFRRAGLFRICYSDDGSFSSGHADVVGVVINVEGFVTARLPAEAGLLFGLTGGLEVEAIEGQVLSLSAGETILNISVLVPAACTFNATGARLRVIAAPATGQHASPSVCLNGIGSAVGPSVIDPPLYAPSGAPTEHAESSRKLSMLLLHPVAFKEGGRFQVCYSDDGSFSPGHVDVVPVLLDVPGATDACAGDSCMALRAFNCYALLSRASELGHCSVPLEGLRGLPVRASWSARFGADYGGDGLPLHIAPQPCGGGAPEPSFVCPWPQLCSSGDLADTVAMTAASEVRLPPARASGMPEASSVAVCYCSGLRGCSVYGSYTQQVGVVYLFAASATLPDDDHCARAWWSGVLAPVPFVLCIRCPPGACSFGGASSRLRLVRGPGVQEQPSWSAGHGCRSAPAASDLLPSGPASADVDGGPRSDWKRFAPRGAPGFSLPLWGDFQPVGTILDACFCLDSCGTNSSTWFKAGELAVVGPRLVGGAATGAATLTPPHEARQYGQLALDRSFLPFGFAPNVLGLETGGMVRVTTFSVDKDGNMSKACNRLPYEKAPEDFEVDIGAGSVRGDRLVFDGGLAGRGVALNGSGLFAVCYCPLLANGSSSECSHLPWTPLAYLAIPGPRAGQTWTLPTFRVARFEYHGFDLQDGDVLRLVSPDSRCDASPVPQALQLCPPAGALRGHEICASTGLPAQAEYSTTTLSYSRIGCDEFNANCRRAPLESLEARADGLRMRLAASSSSIGGLGELGLADGDVVVLEGGVDCGERCTQETLEQARGVRLFAGLQLYLDFEEGSDAVQRLALKAYDRVGGRNFALLGGATWVNPGFLGPSAHLCCSQSLALDEVEPKEPLDITRPWSFLLWARADNASWNTLCGFANSSGALEYGELEIGIAGAPWPGGAVFLQQQGVVEGNVSQMGARVLTSGTWTHIAVVYSGGVSRELRFYLGGVLAYERSGVLLERTDRPMVCGGGIVADVAGGRHRATGFLDLDEVRWYGRPLSAADVAAVAAAADPGLDRAAVPGVAVGSRIARGPDDLTFDVPGLTWRTDPTFTVAAGGGAWRRTNRGVTRAEIMTPNAQRVKVCWGRRGLYSEAGHIQFQPPARLLDVGVYVTSTEWNKVSPFVISFRTTGRTGSSGQAYEQAKGSVTLELVFLDRSRFEITSSTPDGYEMPFEAPFEDELGEESQTVCGKLFRELWSDDPERGFPLAKGCYHRGLSQYMRQIVMVFEPRNALRGSQTYQLVMNGRASNAFDVNRQLVLIQTGDELFERRYTSIHIGHGFMNKPYELGAGKVDPQFAQSLGLEVVEGDARTQVYEMTKPGYVSLRLRGGQGQLAGIRRGNFITLWFWPLTSWKLPTSCADVMDRTAYADSIRLRCSVVVGTARRCGVIDTCIGQSVVKNGNVNSLYIQMPSRMNDLFGTLVFQLQLSNFELPVKGILPHRLAGQVKKIDGTKPNYVISSGPYLVTPIDRRAVYGRLLTNGDENVPFQGVPAHHLYIKLILPTTIRGADFSRPEPDVRDPSKFVVMAPEGFSVLDVTAAPPAGLGNPVLTSTGEAISGLNMSTPSPAPTGFGSPQLDGWRIEGRNCTYTLPDFTMIPAGASVVVGLVVKPTNTSLPISDPANLWVVEVTSPGEHNMTSLVYSQGFYRTGTGGVPVLGELRDAYVQPSDPAVSTSGHVVHWLNVFFWNGDNVTAGGSINVEGPSVFDFGAVCNAEDLEERHYVMGPPRQVYRLPTISRCEGFCDSGCGRSQHLARVTFEGPLVTGRTYGFRVRVTNPSPEVVALEADRAVGGTSPWGWTLRTRGPLADAVAVYTGEVPGAPGLLTSWELRNTTLVAWPSLSKAVEETQPGVAIGLGSALPFKIEQEATLATLLLMLPFDIYGELSAVAPDGYEWLKDMVELQPGPPWNQTATFVDLPSQAQLFGPGGSNVLRFEAGAFRGRARYGFRAPLYVPDFTPTASMPVFYVNVAPLTGAYGAGAGAVVPAEPVRSLVDGVARATHRLPGAYTDFLFQVRLATPVAYPGVLLLRAPPGYEAATRCVLRPWPGTATWGPSHAVGRSLCTWQGDPSLQEGVIVRLNGDAASVQQAFRASYVSGLSWKQEMLPMLGRRYRIRRVETGVVGLPAPDGSGDVWLFPQSAVVREPSGMLRIAPAYGLPLQPGLLRVRLAVKNPPDFTAATGLAEPDVCGSQICWAFESQDDRGRHLDAPQTIAGLDVALEMAEAEILYTFTPPAGRDDRPLQMNHLPVRFRVEHPGIGSNKQLPPGQLQLTGPVGFRFNDRCLPDIETRTVMLFGEGPNPLQRWKISTWERSALVVACEGFGETAILTIASGLYADRAYAFTIAVRNAEETPVINNWTVSFQDRFSRPFRSFEIWTFMDVRVSPLSVHAAARCSSGGKCVGAAAGLFVPVTLFFRPYMTIRTDGHVRIDMPQDFSFKLTPGAALVEGDRPTPCILREHLPTNMSLEPLTWQTKDRDCLIIDKGNPLDNSGTGDLRSMRLVPRYQFNEVDPTPPMVLSIQRIYELIIYVQPPEGYRPVLDWQLESRTAAGELLDKGKVAGYGVGPVLRGLRHTNIDGPNFYTNRISSADTGGLNVMPDLIFEVVLTENLWPADRLVFKAPPGFQLQRPMTLASAPGSCIGLRVVSPSNIASLLPSATELATCASNVLNLPLGNMDRLMYSPTPLQLLMELPNPNVPIPPEVNYWLVEHRSGVGDGLVASAFVSSWPVVPRLLGTSALAFGALKAAGARTTLYFSYRGVQAASEAEIEALQPQGFDFTSAFAVAHVGSRRTVPQILGAGGPHLRLLMIVGEYDPVEMTVDHVLLPQLLGPTSWRVTTYALSESGDQTLLRDRAEFAGFHVSGRIVVSSVTAVTGGNIPDALIGRDDTVLTMHMDSTAPLEAGDMFRVAMSGAGFAGFYLYPLTAELRGPNDELLATWLCASPPLLPGGTLVGSGQNADPGPDCTSGFSAGSVFFDPSTAVYYGQADGSLPVRSLPMQLIASSPAMQKLRLKLRVRTPPRRTEFLLERWNISVFQGANTSRTTLISTNDALKLPLPVVTLLPAEPRPWAPHRPPLIMAEVVLVLDPLDTGAAAFAITAPPGFGGFPRVCSDPRSNNVTALRCRALGAGPLAPGEQLPLPGEGPSFPRARLDCGPGAGVDCLRFEQVVVLVGTPRETPPQDLNVWLVEAVDEAVPAPVGDEVAVGEVIGRRVFPGFDLSPMPSGVVYSSSPSVPIDVVMSFRSRVAVPHLGTIFIAAPLSLASFRCGSITRGSVRPLSPISILSCEDSGLSAATFVRLRLNGTLAAGQHLLAVPATTARAAVPAAENFFEIYLRDDQGRNLDVDVKIQGEPLVQGLRASVWPLWWQSPPPGPMPKQQITVPLEVINDADVPVYGILVMLPPTVVLHPQTVGQVEVHTAHGAQGELPRTGSVLVGPTRNSFLLRLDGKRRLMRGTYLLRFSVVAPQDTPAFNLWRVALCGDLMAENPGACVLGDLPRAGRGAAVLSVFAVAGHDPNAAPQGVLPAVTGGARTARPGAGVGPALAALRCLAALLGAMRLGAASVAA